MTLRGRSSGSRARSYRVVSTQLRWKRFFATTAPGKLGVYTYRAHWLAMIGVGVFGVTHLIEVLPIFAQQQSHLHGWYSIFLAALGVLTGLTLYYGLHH